MLRTEVIKPTASEDYEIVWRPHRDAPSLIADLHPGNSVYRTSSLCRMPQNRTPTSSHVRDDA